MISLDQHHEPNLNTNPLPGRSCRDCLACSESGCLALSCEDLDDELDNLALLTAQAHGDLPEVNPW